MEKRVNRERGKSRKYHFKLRVRVSQREYQIPQTNQRRHKMSIEFGHHLEVFGDFNQVNFNWVIWRKGSWGSGDWMKHWGNNQSWDYKEKCLFPSFVYLITISWVLTRFQTLCWKLGIGLCRPPSLADISLCPPCSKASQPLPVSLLPNTHTGNVLKWFSPWYITGHIQPPGDSSFAGSDPGCSIALLSLGHQGANCPL